MMLVKIGKPPCETVLVFLDTFLVSMDNSVAFVEIVVLDVRSGIAEGLFSLDVLCLQEKIPNCINSLGSYEIHFSGGGVAFKIFSNVLNLENAALGGGVPRG